MWQFLQVTFRKYFQSGLKKKKKIVKKFVIQRQETIVYIDVENM